jgi:hypothetical protein
MRWTLFVILGLAVTACPPPPPGGGSVGDGGLRGGGVNWQSGNIIGTWIQAASDAGFLRSLAFREDGRLLQIQDVETCAAGERTSYSIEGNILTITAEPDDPLSISWDGDMLILTKDGRDMRFVRAQANCHIVPESLNLVGTWEFLDEVEPGAPEALSFTDTGHLFYLSDLGQCTPMRLFQYTSEGDQLFLQYGDRGRSVTVTMDNDRLTWGEAEFRRATSNCHTRLRDLDDLPAQLVGTYSTDGLGSSDDYVAFRSNNTFAIVSNLEGCVVERLWQVQSFGNSLLLDMEGEIFVVQWQQQGFDTIILTNADDEPITLDRIDTDCHSNP